MSNQQQQQGSDKNKETGKATFRAMPKAIDHHISMKWVTLHALENVAERLRVEAGGEPPVILLTAWGHIEGRLCDIQPSYAESFRREGDHLVPDVSSMVTHVRTEMLNAYEKEEKQLQAMDTAPILSLRDVTLSNGTSTYTMPQLTLFADQVIGFTLASLPQIH